MQQTYFRKSGMSRNGYAGLCGAKSSSMINLSDQSLRDQLLRNQSYGVIGTIDRNAIDS